MLSFICVFGTFPVLHGAIIPRSLLKLQNSDSFTFDNRKLVMSVSLVRFCAVVLLVVAVVSTPGLAEGKTLGVENVVTAPIQPAVEEVQQYNRAIHIMAMLLVGFGFLMVFVKKYGRSAITATYLLVATALPLYFLMNHSGFLGHATTSDIQRLILAEFAAASLLICAGALLG